MRTVYLVRHGQTENGLHRCSGSSPVALDLVGCLQARRLGRWFEDKSVSAVYTSPLLRCVQTACLLAAGRVPVREEQELRELDPGLWEGLSFGEIKVRYPAEYAARGEHMGTIPPPGGESFAGAGRRMDGCVRRLLSETAENIVLVGHGGAGRGWLCAVMGLPFDAVLSIRQPWGGVTVLTDGAEGLGVKSVGLQPARFPEDPEIESLLDRADTPGPVRAHSRAVAKKALELAVSVPRADQELLRAACLLHDIVRRYGHGHDLRGAELLDRAGWPQVAEIVVRHHDLGDAPTPEAKLLYLADKLILGETVVTVEERFEKSREKCLGPQALAVWGKRRGDAMKIMKELQGSTT
ncbi:histidine phosphatase family protein [Clostridium sp. KNHs216]|uniref:histidine phosphatase family protein n=1 Tax=Clostridium sp. KNHs216 TaxID=1550235 RepID=UPI001152498E|nr:histidine phosphatase family protein [Clostridium sp. KNHs216]TQI68605.1 putative nucleotidyltransferase with HDIG domain [Clostridium sp. KNHs216]